MTDIEKLVEDCARIFCCGNTCASLHDSRPCCAADHHVRTCAVIRHTLEFAAREGVHNQSKARDANKPIPATSPGVTAEAIEAATRIRNLSAQLSEARREGDLYRRAYGCLSCGECHPPESMCPPHEVRSSGMGSYRQQIGKAVARATAAESEAAALRKRVGVLETALEPFAEAATKGEISGYPPNYFVGATEFENARRARTALEGRDNG